MEMNWFSDSPLVIGLVSAILGGMVTLLPWIHEKRKNKKIADDGYGLTFLFSHIPETRMSFNKKHPNLVDLKLFGGTFNECEAWISLGRGGGKLKFLGRAHIMVPLAVSHTRWFQMPPIIFVRSPSTKEGWSLDHFHISRLVTLTLPRRAMSSGKIHILLMKFSF